jgi:hypothetical protein
LAAAFRLRGGHYDLMAPPVAHRPSRRDEQAVAYTPGCTVQIAVAAGRSEPSRWQVQGCLIGPARSTSIARRRRSALAAGSHGMTGGAWRKLMPSRTGE